MNLKNFWEYVRTFEPARLRAAWIAVLALAATLGISVSQETDAKVTAVIGVIAVVLPLLQGEWTRNNVVPVTRYDNDVEVALNTPVPDGALADAADVDVEESPDFVPDEVV